MSREKPETGSMVWIDLTVDSAETVRDFYGAVVGWTSEEVDMGGYSDYSMNTPEGGTTITGVCHARGINQDMPPAWMPYFTVVDPATIDAVHVTHFDGHNWELHAGELAQLSLEK